MAKKRFTDIEIWDKEWFMELTPKLKCLIRYLFDKCDNAGLWTPNWKLASLHINDTITINDLNQIPEKHYEILRDGKIFIPDFINFQNGRLSRECKPHVQIISILEKNELLDRFDIEDSGTSVKALRKRITDNMKKDIFEKDDYQCQYCGGRPGKNLLFVDHIIPLVKGGNNSDSNLITSCKSCNSKKHDDDVLEFIEKHNLDPLNNLNNKLNTLFNNNNTLQEKDKVKDKEEEIEKEEEEATLKTLFTEPKKEKKFLCPEMQKKFKEKVEDYSPDQDRDYEPLLSIAKFICKQEKFEGGEFKNQQKILDVWNDISSWISKDSFYSQKSLKTISTYIQEVYNKVKNGHAKSSSKNTNQSGKLGTSDARLKSIRTWGDQFAEGGANGTEGETRTGD